MNAKDIIRQLKAGSYDDVGVDEAMKSLYQALVEKMPTKGYFGETTDSKKHARGYNQALAEVNKILKEYFGVSDE
jgi:hypothetical protein